MIYNSFKKNLMAGEFDLENDTIKVMLVDNTYTPDIDAHEFISDVTGEVTGTGYTAGGATLSNVTVTQDNVDDEGVFDADDVTWSSATITARYAVIYKDTGTTTTSPLICCIDFGADKGVTALDFVIQWNSEGIININ